MAYRFVVSEPLIRVFDGLKYTTYEIFEDDDAAGSGIEPSSEWTIPNIPTPSEITHYESDLETGGAAVTINPRLGLKAGFAEDKFDSLPNNATAAAYIRNQDVSRIKVRADGTGLHGRSNPDIATGATGQIRTAVTIRWGHS